jgi:hypothetical protein
MLSFTQNNRNNKDRIQEIDYQPLIISNKPTREEPFPKQPQKKISSTMQN